MKPSIGLPFIGELMGARAGRGRWGFLFAYGLDLFVADTTGCKEIQRAKYYKPIISALSFSELPLTKISQS